MRIALIPNMEKPPAVAAARALLPVLGGRAAVEVIERPTPEALRAASPELVVVLGGDGSILHIASAMEGLDAPVLGINFGKLGYLAAYALEEFLVHLDVILTGRAPVTTRLMLEGMIFDDGGDVVVEDLLARAPRFRYVALNDIVVNAGPPFKMIEMHVRVDQEETTTFRGDGVIVATSSGSTGYNLSAGGPLLTPDVHAMVLTPICPHSLSFRPVVLSDASVVLLRPARLNAGTGVSFDGQVTMPLTERQCVLVRKAARPLTLVENPSMSHWRMLAQKLHWAHNPRQ